MMEELEVIEILSTAYDGDEFPGYENIRLSFSQLETIIRNKRSGWLDALRNQKAVYLITDTSNGKMYVGSATAQYGMLLQRWTNYIDNGHGGNVELKHIVDTKGFDYIKANFQYSVLENYNARMDDNYILSRQGNISVMYNYIIPLIGDVKLDELTPRLMDKFYQSLLKVKTKVVQNKKPKNEYLTVHTVREIHKFLRSAFNQAVKWELMTRNPVLNATLPKEEHQKREIWTAETLMHALEVCDDDILALAINLSFACSLRMGEMLGLTWDCIDISEESLKENNASIFVDKELQRVNRDVMEVLDNKDIIRVFPRTLSNTNTSLVLKTPKTKTSVRKIFLPSTVAQMLLERKKQIDEMKELFGDEYLDYDLVFCHSSGRPMEGQVINRALKKLIQDNDLPDVVFHSFRHASITYKLKWNGGDMKSVQGDSGHARMDMVADVYSHIIDEDRRYNAQKFEEQFYNAKGLKNAEEGKTAPMPKFETSVELLDPMAEVQKESEVEKEKPAENSTDENAALLTKLLSNPETAALLKALAKTI